MKSYLSPSWHWTWVLDYGVIKHCSDDEFGTLGVDYEKYESMYGLLKEAEEMSNYDTKIIVKWEKIK